MLTAGFLNLVLSPPVRDSQDRPGISRRKSPLKLLLNAEAFGFGPSAAIAAFLPHLRANFAHIAYAGVGHSLDLQRNLPYDAIHDLSDSPPGLLTAIVSQYDLFFTALDFDCAQAARAVGVPTIVYDALAWYWPKLPEVLQHGVLYIAQQFFGVSERLNKEKDDISEYRLVAPILPDKMPKNAPEIVLINLGGLQNPHWTPEIVAAYARVAIDILKRVVSSTEKISAEQLVVATSQKIASILHDPAVQTYTREQMLEILPRVRYAVATPGMGNIYDAAGYDIPTVFLPPANDSQALQLAALTRENMLDAAVDWPGILPHSQTIDYCAGQPAVLRRIAEAVSRLRDDRQMQERFAHACMAAIAEVKSRRHSATAGLIQRFGRGGARQVADIVTAYADGIESARSRVAGIQPSGIQPSKTLA